MKKVFDGFTKEEANRKADEWLAGQKGLRKILRSQIAIGDDGPSLRGVEQVGSSRAGSATFSSSTPSGHGHLPGAGDVAGLALGRC
jgi:hypothetical protein